MSIFGLRRVVFYLSILYIFCICLWLYLLKGYVSYGACIDVLNSKKMVSQNCGLSLSPGKDNNRPLINTTRRSTPPFFLFTDLFALAHPILLFPILIPSSRDPPSNSDPNVESRRPPPTAYFPLLSYARRRPDVIFNITPPSLNQRQSEITILGARKKRMKST